MRRCKIQFSRGFRKFKRKRKSKLEGYEDFIGEKINKFSEDESWRVRLMLAKFIPDIFEVVKKISEGKIIQR